jgi:hypothetical protein
MAAINLSQINNSHTLPKHFPPPQHKEIQMILSSTKNCLAEHAVQVLTSKAPQKSAMLALRVKGFVLGSRVYAQIELHDEHMLADVVTGTLFDTTGKQVGRERRIDLASMAPCTRDEARKWFNGAAQRARDWNVKTWRDNGGVVA